MLSYPVGILTARFESSTIACCIVILKKLFQLGDEVTYERSFELVKKLTLYKELRSLSSMIILIV
ncbi:MAG: hypothetical protein GAK29_04688 [Acinetobacter bereziniae]|uniref:Uncharacterized protein n=1 Tax=Acinetobacter bereziniae TaxID=106648 RepID=A0A833UIN3_ACIBZ|nr:MAG: hypothetical protein GAK29_04688 [Acinetobacter bereziniae]